MRAGAGAALAAMLAAFLALTPAGASGQSPKGNPAVADALLDEARQDSGIGEWEKAAACLDEAAVQDPGNSDLLYLRALASVRLGMPYAGAIGDLDAALGASRFRKYARRDASALKAELLVRERRWEAALDALGSPGADNQIDPAYGLVRARALAGLGDFQGFAGQIGDCLRRFPDDAAAARLFLARAGKIPSSDKARALGELILGRLKGYEAADPELPVLAAPLMPDLASRKDAVLAYRAKGGTSAKATLRALEYGIVDEAAASSELLSGAYPVALNDLKELMALAGSPAGRDAVGAALAAWSGTVLVDEDSDGVYEGRFELAKGLVRSWSRDSKQAGLVDERAEFSADGLPESIRLAAGDLEIEVEYSSYPAVSKVAFIRSGSAARYAFAPEAFSFAPLAMDPFAGSGRNAIYLPSSIEASPPSERSCASAALSVETASGDEREVVTLDRGLPVSAVTFVGDRIFSERKYEKGHPVLERVDADGDGRFEMEKGFAPAKGAREGEGPWDVAWIRCDADGDGVFEYRERTAFPRLKEWDFDGNGSVDAAREDQADGSVKESFSSRLDGRLDEEIVVKDGKVVSLSRSGRRLALTPDANGQVTWIGEKRFDLGTDLPAGEGIFKRSGMRYRLIRIGALAFAELIP